MSRHASDDSFWSSYADLATGMMAIFLLVMAALTVALKEQDSDRQREEEQRQKASEAQRKEIERLSKQVQIILGTRAKLADSIKPATESEVGIQSDPVTAQVVFDDANGPLKFEENKSTLSPAGKSFLDGFIPKYVCALRRQECQASPTDSACGRLDPEAPNAVRRIIVTGHADLKGRPTKNFQLSAQRATEVVAHSLALLAKPEGLAGTPCHGQHIELSQYAQERMVALGAGDVIHCRDRHSELAKDKTCHEHPRRDGENAEEGYRKVTFELELTGSDMTGLVLDLIQLRQAVGIEDTPDSTGTETLSSLQGLRDEIAPRCFEDPGAYQGCEAFIQACWTHPELKPEPSSSVSDCAPVKEAAPDSAVNSFIARNASAWEQELLAEKESR